MTKRVLLYGLVLAILFAVAVTAGRQDDNEALLQQYAQNLSAWLAQQDAVANHNLSPSQERQSGNGEKSAFTIITHRADSILDYSNNKIIPSPLELKALSAQRGNQLIRLTLGWFYAKVESQPAATHSILIPIRYELDFNELTGNAVFPCDKNIPQNLQLSEQKTPHPVVLGQQELCWLKANGPIQSGWLTWVKLCAWALFFVVFFNGLNQVARSLSQRFGMLPAVALLVLVIGGLLYYNLKTGWTAAEFGSLELFKQSFEGANLIGTSVGDWLIHVGLFVFLMVFLHRNYQAQSFDRLPAGIRIAIAGIHYLLMMCSIPLSVLVLRQLVYNNINGFDFENILGIGASGFLSLSGVLGLMTGLFLFSHRLMLGVRDLRLSRNIRLGLMLLAVALLAVVSMPLGINPLYVALFAGLFAFSMDTFAHWEGYGFGWLVVWVLLFSLFSSLLISRFNGIQDKNLRVTYAQALVNERDTAITEPLLPVFLADLERDSVQISQVLKPWPFKGHIEELRALLNGIALRQPYLFQHYRLKAAAFDQDNQPILVGQTIVYQELVLENWAQAKPLDGSPSIRYLMGADGKFRYYLQWKVGRAMDASQRVQMFVTLEHEFPAQGRAYTEIFFNSPYKNLDHLSRFNFAVQKNGRVVVEQSRGSLAALSADLEAGAVKEIASASPPRVDAVAKSADGQTIAAVGHAQGGWLKQVYLFSILFTLASLLLLALAFANSWLNFLPEAYDFRLTAKGSLARRIHLWNVSLLAVSFLVVGFLTYRHFTETARATEQAAFDYRAEALQNNLEAPFLSQLDSNISPNLHSSVKSITNSLGVDANFYSPKGQLMFSTQEDLVALGLLPAKMNVGAQQKMIQEKLPEIQLTEQVGGNEYLTKYRPCRNGRGELFGFLSVPNPLSQEKIGADVSDFIGMLASLYVFLLLIAYAVTFVLSRSIIKPLSLLSEKVQELKLEDKNAPLEYAGDSQDEISELIGQYNTMVEKLESSKVQLVRLEREGAWREMAKQVAHDIKNPLTTMKLSMQQLERVSNNPEQAAAYLRKAITRLIEQIDSLAQIASEFSMFANLDIRQKSDVVINEVVESVHDLFSEQKNVQLELSLPDGRFHILGDKNHLIRVFNNLVINAIQAIPSDRQGHVKVSLTNQNGLSVVKISDNGGGIPPEIGERVFEPNFTTKTSGSGLGLAICKKIIEAHDGNIRFETRENEGTDFFVEIPVTSTEA
jgi:signal transduction histidine kinase